MEYSDYLALLSELCQLFDQISHVEQQKIDAVQGHALDELNEAMKREQALTLALRGCEQKRETLLTGLGLTGISLRDMPPLPAGIPGGDQPHGGAGTEGRLRRPPGRT